jgi:hypothetical protein
MKETNARQSASVLGREYFAGRIARGELLEKLAGAKDPLVRALAEAITLEPRIGFWGVRRSVWEEQFHRPVMLLLEQMEKGDEGLAPRGRVFPRLKLGAVLIPVVFCAFAAARGVQTALEGSPVFSAVFAVCSLGLFIEVVRVGRLYGTQDRPYE